MKFAKSILNDSRFAEAFISRSGLFFVAVKMRKFWNSIFVTFGSGFIILGDVLFFSKI